MRIVSKGNIKKAIQNPLCFIIIFCLLILALANSFALWCFMGAILAIPFALFGKDSNAVIQLFCNDSSWKLKVINMLSEILGSNTIFIIILGVIIWLLINHTETGKNLFNYLD